MTWQYTPHLVPLLVSGAISAALAVYAWRHRNVTGASGFMLLMTASAVWSLVDALYFAATGLEAKLWSAKLLHLGATMVPVGWLILVLQHTGRTAWLTRRRLAVIAAVPVVTLALIFTNELHGLYWSKFELSVRGGLVVTNNTAGPLFWFHLVYAWALITLSILLLLGSAGEGSALQRRQARVLLIAAILPWLGNVLYYLRLVTFAANPMPFLFTLSGIALAWGVFRFRLFDIVPVARDAVIEGMSDAVVVLDAESRIVDLNPAARRIIGPLAEVGIGKMASHVLSAWADGIRPNPATGAAQAEIRLGEGDARRDYDLRISPLLDPKGFLSGKLLVMHDVTERKRGEEELRVAKEVAEQASLTKTQFLANMSHELRTPLNAIIGFSELLMEEVEDRGLDELSPDLERIRDSGRSLLGLINDILDVSKIEAGKMDIYPETFGLAALLGEVLATVRPLAAKRGNELRMESRPDLGTMRTDVTKLRQMLLNLLSNALKFTERGTVTVAVERTEDGRRVAFRVTDTGIGMTEAEMGRLFQPFTQADASTTRRYGGTGLGLTITRRFCEMLGGEIGVESEPGRGTGFTITLPAEIDTPATVPDSIALPGIPRPATLAPATG
ncbi:MAG TPA: histidine kinase N-terminal 7TM domain-containing protein [Longimicrobiaceae bacterium]|jgi:signal transduction histidine kinase|nr:histidine kinase N-terminal 7TM domain-containing protein [Longimicrobiaceae bacterium]